MVTLTSARNTEAFSPYMTNHEKRIQMGKKKEEDEEIGVFRAEKYFNGVIDDDTSSRISSISSVRSYNHPYKNGDRQIQRVPDIDQIRSKVHPRTPSARSESSWNSRSVLLQSTALKNSSRSKSSKMNGMKFLASLGCKCSCSDKNSVDTKDVGEISFSKSGTSTNPSCGAAILKPNSVSSVRPSMDLADAINQMNRTPRIEKAGSAFPSREGSSSFRSTKSPSGLMRNVPPVKSPFLGRPEILCKSPEVFGSSSSPALEKGNKTMSFERRITMMSWDHATSRPNEIVSSVVNSAAGGINHHDSGSDASSDLFEIDSLTGKTNPFRARRLSDDTASGCMTPTHGYAPSEASIQWSVVTASAADFSVLSDCEETTTIRPQTTSKKMPSAKARILDAEVMHRRRSSTSALLGCKNHKAVNVAGDAYMDSPKINYDAGLMRYRSDSPASFQTEVNKFTDFNSRVGHHSLSTQSPIPRLHSPRNSHLLYIQ
ncbi:protein PHYTOCHROME KINASE SUBSTRATE 1-like [Humulus lupulus]|uniref:protein PHYTOCHROME KINASE SUBSTRATE 1-like n=1 Tax=Humulus lupulus TaxID=3486 RepID=UPI002B40B5D8|nr:protein PHYTOCHROME KINASE SUBSTRATE 1-like [Humulus lupulus]